MSGLSDKKKAPSAKQIARMAVLTALSAVFLVAANILPSGRIGTLALSSFPVCIVLMMYGWKWAVGAYVVSALLGLVILPGDISIAYGLFFGCYPVFKSLFERCRRLWLCIVLKAVLYFILFALCALLLTAFFGDALMRYPVILLFFGGAVLFFVYDWAYSLLIRLYIEKLARYFHD